MAKGKAVGFHSCADGFAVCSAAPCVIRHEHGTADRTAFLLRHSSTQAWGENAMHDRLRAIIAIATRMPEIND